MKKECYPEYSGDAEFKTSDIRKNRWFFYTQNLETFRKDITHLHTSGHVESIIHLKLPQKFPSWFAHTLSNCTSYRNT